VRYFRFFFWQEAGSILAFLLWNGSRINLDLHLTNNERCINFPREI
jgi:hypothetical protein